MRVIQHLLILLSCSIFSYTVTQAQLRPAYGITGNYNLNIYQADFRNFPNIPSCCPMYQDGTGNGLSLGLLYETPFNQKMRLALRAGYSSRSGTLTRTENLVVTGNIPGVFEHRVDASLADIGIEPLLEYNTFSSLWLNLGGRIGYVTTKTFSQKETIVSPSDGVFPNGSSTRNEFSDIAIPDASSLYAAILGGLSYDLPLNKQQTLLLAPEILYSLGVTPVVSGLEWSSSSLRIGLALKYSPQPRKEPVEKIEKKQFIDTVRKEAVIASAFVVLGKENTTTTSQATDDEILITETLRRIDTLVVPINLQIETPITLPNDKSAKGIISSTVSANGVSHSGTEMQTVKIEIEEFSSVLMTPILNYIFFDDNSSTLPSRYKQLDKGETNSFQEEKINSPDRLTTYYHILNIIGQRMIKNQDATLTLIGCNADFGAEKGNLNLSKQRAEEVKNYLTKRWQIPESRLKIESRNLPEKAALTQTEDGYAENRRVEIISNSPAITAPIITNDTFRMVSPPSVRFRPKVVSGNAPAQWSLTAEQDGKVLKRFEGTDGVPSVLDWDIEKEQGTHPRTEKGLKYTLNVTDGDNRTTTSDNVIPVEQTTIRKKRAERRGDKEVNRYSLILFDVRSTEINAVNKPVISLIKSNITPSSTVKIAGYTDRLGDAKVNQSLAEGRARITKDALGIREDAVAVTSKGNAMLYDAELPEGRLYTRTVDVVVETPIKE